MEGKAARRVAITGIGMSDIGRRLMVNPLSLTMRACDAAIADAGLTAAGIDGLGAVAGFAPPPTALTAVWHAAERSATFFFRHCSAAAPPVGTPAQCTG